MNFNPQSFVFGTMAGYITAMILAVRQRRRKQMMPNNARTENIARMKHETDKVCPMCDGWGSTDDMAPCSTCGGYGTVPKASGNNEAQIAEGSGGEGGSDKWLCPACGERTLMKEWTAGGLRERCLCGYYASFGGGGAGGGGGSDGKVGGGGAGGGGSGSDGKVGAGCGGGSSPSAYHAAITEVLNELAKARAKFPEWPTDPVHAAAVVAEEAGELVKASLEACYEPGKRGTETRCRQVHKEAVQTAAVALRFIIGLDEYEFKPGGQKPQ